MVEKKELIEHFQKDYQKYWKVKLFDDLGFKRKQCTNCNKFFWTLTEQTICNDATCKTYDFIGNPPTEKKLNYIDTWKVIEKFFTKNDHTSIKPYPVICRWVPNLYFTIAGIVDFLRVDNGKISFDFPVNPSILTQPCLRFNDVVNTGINAKSYTCFTMIQQSSLYNNKEGYWKDRCIELDWQLLTKEFGIKPEEIVFIEDAWLGPSAFGSSLEYHVQGLELGNAVFTEFAGTLDDYREMKDKVVDMGAGHERFTWITQGTPTSYDAVFSSIIEKFRKICDVDYDKEFFVKYSKFSGILNADESDLNAAKKEIAKRIGANVEEIENKTAVVEAMYAIIEHARALAFAISGGGLPSNVAGGYNLRLILRRALSFIDKFNWPIKLEDIALWHAKDLKKLFPELLENEDSIVKILQVEEKRYRESKKRSKKIIESFKGKEASEDELIKIYESQGISPEDLGIEVPQGFYDRISKKHMGKETKDEKVDFDLSNVEPTKILYYDNVFDFDAKVILSHELENGKSWVVLDQTGFYPTGGGQMHDKGLINNLEVLNVIKIGNVVIHLVAGNLKKRETVSCKVDKNRREILMKHHDAVHIVNGAVKRVLGKHANQYGSEKDVDKARLDVTHYEAITDDQVEKIEQLANEIVEKGLAIKKTVMSRSEAEQKFGFSIYQGGYVPSKEIRIANIEGWDVEACGGTHGTNTKDVGWIVITKTKRIADGLSRIELKAGDVAEAYLKEKESTLKEVSRKLKVKEEDVPKEVERIFKEWKQMKKRK